MTLFPPHPPVLGPQLGAGLLERGPARPGCSARCARPADSDSRRIGASRRFGDYESARFGDTADPAAVCRRCRRRGGLPGCRRAAPVTPRARVLGNGRGALGRATLHAGAAASAAMPGKPRRRRSSCDVRNGAGAAEAAPRGVGASRREWAVPIRSCRPRQTHFRQPQPGTRKLAHLGLLRPAPGPLGRFEALKSACRPSAGTRAPPPRRALAFRPRRAPTACCGWLPARVRRHGNPYRPWREYRDLGWTKKGQ